MMTGMMGPSWYWVLALNCLQNSMMFSPCCPRAGPTGGAGVAFPPGICNLICPVTFLAIFHLYIRNALSVEDPYLTDFFYLQEVQLNRSRSAEDGNHYFQSIS